MTHHAELFLEGDLWGWQCLTPTCRQEATGFEDIEAAQSSMDEHLRAASPEASA